jgi:hypothetical protein
MGQYRNGYFTTADPAAAVTLELGFLPDRFVTRNWTAMAADATAVIQSEFYRNVTPAGYASQISKTITTLALTQANITTNGFTLVSTGGDWDTTQAVITAATKANPCVITATTHGFATGDTVTISSVVGMTQLNTNRYIITVVDANSFSLSDLFGNPVNSSAFGTYVSGGIANKISTDETPPGLQEDEGFQGITLGTGVVGAAGNVIFWEAFLETPTGY